MSVELVGGVALEVSYSLLYDAVKEVIGQTSMFKPLEDINSTLDTLQPLIKEISEDPHQEELQSFRMQMEEGIDLIHNCSKVSSWSIYEKHKYTYKLVELSNCLQSLLDILKVQGIRDVKKNLVSVKNVERVVQEIEGHYVNPTQSEKVEGWGAVPEIPRLTVGLDVPLKELKINLFKDEVSMLIITAPGGCGKTTLATKFCQDGEVRDKFKNNIFFVTVSKKANLNLIVQELYQRKGSQVPDFENEAIAVNWLQEFLKQLGQNPFLLVLDDVWSDSESLLEKFNKSKMPNYKILVTSRFAFPRFGSAYYLRSLNDEDAMALFNDSALLGDRSSYIPEDLSRKIVEHCKGFPLAITVVGRSLCGQPIESWQTRILEWTKGSSVFDSDRELFVSLKSSIDDLEKVDVILKECFTDLGSFPEDQSVPATTLIYIWTELYNIDEDSLCIANLYELVNRSLANLVIIRKDSKEVDGYYAQHFVTQHDMLRELAIYETSRESIEQRKKLIIDVCGDNFPKWWTEQKHQPLSARLLSISTDGDFSSQWPDMQLPEVKVLILNFQTKKYALPAFVEKMDKLRVLIVTNYSLLPAEVDNFPLLGSLSNLKGIKLDRISIPSISKNPIQLKSIKKISLFMCNIGQTFTNFSIKSFDLLPNVEEINIDYCNDLVEVPAMICDLISLKQLSITHSHNLSALPEDIGKLVNLEVLRLRSCTELSELPDSIRNMKMLKFLDISDCFSIKELPEHIGEMCNLEKFNMRQCSRLQDLPASVLDLEHLNDVLCDEETACLWEPFLSVLRNLHIRVVEEEFNLNWLHEFPS